MRRMMVGLLVGGLAWGGLSVPSAAALTLSGDEVVVWETAVDPGLNRSTTLDIAEAGDLVLSAEGSVSATEARILTDSSGPDDPALEGASSPSAGDGVGESADHELYLVAAAGIDGTLSWPQGVRAERSHAEGSVAAGQTVVESFTPSAAGPATVMVDWIPEIVSGQVTRTAQAITASQQQASLTVDDAPDLFEVNASGVDGQGGALAVTGLLSWEQETVPTRNLDLVLNNLSRGETFESAQLTGDEERISEPVPAGVTLGAGELFSFEVRNRSTESHEYTLAWSYPRLAEVHVALYDPDGQLVDDATDLVHGQSVATDVPAEHVGGTYTVEITSQDHPADYEATATYNISEHADVRLELLDRTGQVVAAAADDDGQVELSHVAPESGAHTWRVTNLEASDDGASFETPVPSYSLHEQVVLLGATELGGVLPAGATSAGELEVSDPGPMSATVTWDSVVGGMPLERAASVGGGGSSTTALRVTDDGPIEATLDWTQPSLTITDSDTIIPGLEPTSEYAVPVRRTGSVRVSLTHESSYTADFVLELLDPEGDVVASAGPAPHTIDPPPGGEQLSYEVVDYTEGQGDYILRVSTEGTGGDFDIDIDYPTTADLSLQLRRDGQVVDEVAGRDRTLTHDHTGEPADYQLRVVSADRGAAYTLAGHYPAHAAVTATLRDPNGATIASDTAIEGELALTADSATAGSHTLQVRNDSTEFDTPSYDATVLAPARHDMPVEISLLDPDFNVVAELSHGQTRTIPVTAGQYRINATAPSSARAHIEAYMAFDATIEQPIVESTVFATETISVSVEPGVTIDTIDLLVDGRHLTTLTGGATSHAWDTTLVNDGERAITAEVTDINGRTAQANTGVVVANALSADQRLTADHDDGDLTDDDYALNMAKLAGGEVLSSPYDVPIGHGMGTSIVHALSLWDSVSTTTQDELMAILDFEPLTDTSGEQGLAAASSGNCQDQQKKIVWVIKADCFTTIHGFDVMWRSIDFPNVKSDTTVPYAVRQFMEGMDEAAPVYDGLGFSRPFTPAVLFHPIVSPFAPAVSLPEIDDTVTTLGGNPWLAPNIIVNPRVAVERMPELGAHELFHSYQYEWVQLDLIVPVLQLVNGADHLQSVEWWMEASAEWATHHWGEDQNLAASHRRYHTDLGSFLGSPTEALEGDAANLSPGQPRYYGGFIVAEWLQSRESADTIREVWEAVTVDPATNTGVDPVQAIHKALDDGFGPVEVARMWRDLYMLDIASPSFVNVAETNEYREHLQDGGLFTPGRMARRNLGNTSKPVTFTDGATPAASGTIGRAGAQVFEFDTTPNAPLTITVSGTSTLEAELLPLAEYDTDPENQAVNCVFPDETRSGGTITIKLPDSRSQPCAGYALIIVNTSLTRGHRANFNVRMRVGQAGGGELATSKIRLGINAEGDLGVPGHDDAASRDKEDDPNSPISRHDQLGLRLKATNWEALPFNEDGWGVADSARGTAGYVPGEFGAPVGLSRIEASFQSSRVVTSSRAGRLLVEHTFQESPDSHLMQITTKITNTSAFSGPTDITYRRRSDWTLDFSNDPFPNGDSSWERITVATPPPRTLPAEILGVADGHGVSVSPDPRTPRDDGSSNEIGLVQDHGPANLGTTFDIGFYNVGYLDTVTFTQYYGAARNEGDALGALRRVGAEAWAFGQDADTASTGTPHTFIWGYRR